MKVLLLFPMQDRQTGSAIKYAFEKLGHTIEYVDAKICPNDSYLFACHIKPDLVFCSRTPQLTEEVKKIKQKFPLTTIATWNVDTRNSIQEWERLFPLIKLCDYYFVVASNLIPDWREINPNTYWLPQGVQEEVYHKPESLSEADTRKYTCDVSFAGSCTGYHVWRQPYLQAIEKMGVNFNVCQGVYNEEHNKMVACSKINFTYSGWHENGKYVSVRNYKILGAGGFLLEFLQNDLYSAIPYGTHDSYVSIENLVAKIEYWLYHERERKQVAERGYQWVHSHATYTHRIQRALEIMGL